MMLRERKQTLYQLLGYLLSRYQKLTLGHGTSEFLSSLRAFILNPVSIVRTRTELASPVLGVSNVVVGAGETVQW